MDVINHVGDKRRKQQLHER